jgi:hypothetical protein
MKYGFKLLCAVHVRLFVFKVKSVCTAGFTKL